MIESHMREQHPNSEEVVFVLSAAEFATVLAHGEPKTKNVHALNQEFKVPNPLRPQVASAVAPGSAARIESNGNNSSNSSSNNSRTSSPSGSEYCPSESASDGENGGHPS